MADVLRRALGLVLGGGASKVLLLVVELYLARELSAGSYGRFAICMAMLLVVGQLSLVGVDFAIVRFLAVYQEQRRADKIRSLLRWALGLVAGAGGLAAVVVVLGADAIAGRIFGKPEVATGLMLVGFAIPFEAVNQCIAAAFRGVRRVPEQVLVSDLIRNVTLVAGVLVMPWMPLSLEYLAALLLLGTLASFGVGLLALRRQFRGLPRPAAGSGGVVARELIAFSWPVFVWNVFQKLAGRVQILLAAIFLDSAEVGILALMLRIVLVFTFVQTVMNYAAPVEFARLSHLGHGETLRRLFQRLSQVLLGVALFVALPVVIAPATILQAFGGAYPAAAGFLLWLVVIQVLNVGTGPIGHLLINTGNQRALLFVALGGSIIQVVASVALTRVYGLTGAVAAEVATGAFMIATRHALASRLLGVHAFTRPFFGLLGVGILSAALGIAMLRLQSGAAPYAAAVLTAAGVYVALVRTIFFGNVSLREAMAIAWRGVRWRRGPDGRDAVVPATGDL